MANYPPVGAPRAEKRERLANKYSHVKGPEFQDGGVDTFLPNTTPVRRWRDTYRGLTVAARDVLITWDDANYGGHLSYTFTDRDGVAWGGVKTIRFETGHDKRYVNSHFVIIEFEDRP